MSVHMYRLMAVLIIFPLILQTFIILSLSKNGNGVSQQINTNCSTIAFGWTSLPGDLTAAS